MAQVAITSTDIKTYLVISSTSYDANITAIIDLWTDTIEDMINPTKLTDPTLAGLIKTAKVLMIASQVKDVLPNDILGNPSERVEQTLSKITTVIDNRSRGKSSNLWDKGIEILKPYLKDEFKSGNIRILSSTENHEREFTLTEKDVDGNILKTGSMEGW